MRGLPTAAGRCARAPQMKKRYSSAKPYGEWLSQELVTLEQIVQSVPDSGGEEAGILSEPVWACPNLSGPVWACLGCPNLSEPVWAYVCRHPSPHAASSRADRTAPQLAPPVTSC